jgi:high-affinity Fe2+/Pb2+ permease
MRIDLIRTMLNAAFVVLRELAELLLIALAVLGCAKSDRRQGLRWVVAASIGAGIAAGSAAMAFVRGAQFDPRVEALCAIVLGGATLWMALTILFSNRAVRDYVETVVEGLPGSGRGSVSMAMLSAFCMFAGELSLFSVDRTFLLISWDLSGVIVGNKPCHLVVRKL